MHPRWLFRISSTNSGTWKLMLGRCNSLWDQLPIFRGELAVSFREGIDQCSNHGFPLAPQPLNSSLLTFPDKNTRHGRHVGWPTGVNFSVSSWMHLVASYITTYEAMLQSIPTKTPKNASSSNKPSITWLDMRGMIMHLFFWEKMMQKMSLHIPFPFFLTNPNPTPWPTLRVFGHHNCSIPRCLVHTPSPQSSRKLL